MVSYLNEEGYVCPLAYRENFFVREAHDGDIMGHFGINKTDGILEEQL